MYKEVKDTVQFIAMVVQHTVIGIIYWMTKIYRTLVWFVHHDPTKTQPTMVINNTLKDRIVEALSNEVNNTSVNSLSQMPQFMMLWLASKYLKLMKW